MSNPLSDLLTPYTHVFQSPLALDPFNPHAHHLSTLLTLTRPTARRFLYHLDAALPHLFEYAGTLVADRDIARSHARIALDPCHPVQNGGVRVTHAEYAALRRQLAEDRHRVVLLENIAEVALVCCGVSIADVAREAAVVELGTLKRFLQ